MNPKQSEHKDNDDKKVQDDAERRVWRVDQIRGEHHEQHQRK